MTAEREAAPQYEAAKPALLEMLACRGHCKLVDDQHKACMAHEEGRCLINDLIEEVKARRSEQGPKRAATEAEIAEWLDEGFSIKVLNPELGNYWRCPHCDMADHDGHEQSCVIRAMAERLAGRFIPFAGAVEPTEPEAAQCVGLPK